LYFGYSELNPSALKLQLTSRTRSSLVNATFAIPGTHPQAICHRLSLQDRHLPERQGKRDLLRH